MDPMRRTALTAGVLYLVTFVSIPTLFLYQPVKSSVGTFILGAGSDTGVVWGALSEIVVGIAGIATAVVLYPVMKRVSQTAALGLVTARLLETSLIFVGVIHLLSILTLRNGVVGTPGADPSALVTVGQSLVAGYNSTFLVSGSLMPVACDLLLGYLLYRSGLVPRILPIIAFIGAPAVARLRHRRLHGSLPAGVPARRSRRAAGGRVRVLPRCVADRQGLQAQCADRSRHRGATLRSSRHQC